MVTNRPKSKHIKNKKWWDDDLSIMISNQKEAYKRYKASEFKCLIARKDLKHYKNLIRKRKKENMSILRDREACKLSKLYRSNRNAFWKAIKNTQAQKITPTSSIEILREEYKKLFNEKIINSSNSENDQMESELNEYKKELSKINRFDYKLNPNDIETIIRELPTGKAKGFSDTSSEMFKYGAAESLLQWLVRYWKQ